MRSRIVLVLYCGWILAVIALSFVSEVLHVVVWVVLALSAAAALVIGIGVHRPRPRAPWWLFVATMLVGAGGSAMRIAVDTGWFPSFVDVFHLGMYLLAAAGLLLVWRRVGSRDTGRVLDAVSLAVALGMLSWILLIDPYLRDSGQTWLERATAITYPVGDLLLLAVLAQLLVTCGRGRTIVLLAAGAIGLLVSDVLYALFAPSGSGLGVGPFDVGWVLFHLAWGAAALHPSMARLTALPTRERSGMNRWRFALAVVISLIPPTALLADALTGGVQNGPTIAICSAVLVGLMLVRLSGVMARHGQALDRERALRCAGADLVSAAGVEDVAAAVSRAVEQLVPAGSPQRTVLLVPADGSSGATGTHALLVVPSPEWASTWSDFVDAPGTSSLVAVGSLDGVAAAASRGFPTALVCPLVPHRAGADRAALGLLVVAAAEPPLLVLRGSLEVLASQAALAVERGVLVREMGRRDSEAYFRTLVQNTADVILVVRDDGRVRYASPSALTVLGATPLVGRPVLDLLDPSDRATAARVLADPSRSSAVEARLWTYRILRPDGKRVDVEVAARDLRADPTVDGIVFTLRDVTEQRRLEGELTHRAFHDSLTGLANRVLFQDRVEHAITRATADDDGGMIGVLLIDLDDFNLVNDTIGHGTGDDLLVAVAARLTALLHPQDTPARLGGDEFAVLIEDATQPGEVDDLAARIVEALRGSFDVAGGLTTSVSVGVVSSCEAEEPAELLRRADLALYAAKAAGKSCWRRYEPGLHLAAVDRVAMRTELQQAMAADEFGLRYQPIVDLVSGATVGFEALLRWLNPRRGTVPPTEFIPIAEETGLIVPLGAWVLDRALADLAQWRELAPGAVPHVNVNVSAHQVRAPGFVEEVSAALARRGVPADALTVEITETALLTDDPQVTSNLAALHEHGVLIAIDDFGTGFASLDYIRLHAVDSLKIDRSFVDGVETSARQTALVGTIVHLAHALTLPVVAEGIETPAQRNALLTAGCRLGQGHLFSVPLPPDQALPWLLASPAPTAGTGTVEDAPRRAGARRTDLKPTRTI